MGSFVKILDARVAWAEERWGFGVGIKAALSEERFTSMNLGGLEAFQGHVLLQLQNYTFENLATIVTLDDVEWTVRDKWFSPYQWFSPFEPTLS